MHVSLTQSIALVKSLHGVSPGKHSHKAYQSPTGDTFIGWGHSIRVSSASTPLSADRAHAILVSDLTKARDHLASMVTSRIDPHHWNALTCWLWSVQHGHAGNPDYRWEDSALLKHVNEGRLIVAAGEFDNWCYHNGKLSRWMARLRSAERILFCTGELP